jgi:hypothetical protein
MKEFFEELVRSLKEVFTVVLTEIIVWLKKILFRF